MAKNKNTIQFLLNDYLETFGSIDLLLPDGVKLQIGITQEGKHGIEKCSDYCWVVTSRDDRMTMLDRYVSTMKFSEDRNHLVDNSDTGFVTVL